MTWIRQELKPTELNSSLRVPLLSLHHPTHLPQVSTSTWWYRNSGTSSELRWPSHGMGLFPHCPDLYPDLWEKKNGVSNYLENVIGLGGRESLGSRWYRLEGNSWRVSEFLIFFFFAFVGQTIWPWIFGTVKCWNGKPLSLSAYHENWVGVYGPSCLGITNILT